jgi:hypothetical protein
VPFPFAEIEGVRGGQFRIPGPILIMRLKIPAQRQIGFLPKDSISNVKREVNDDEPKYSYGSYGGSIVIFGNDGRDGARHGQEGAYPDDVSGVGPGNV